MCKLPAAEQDGNSKFGRGDGKCDSRFGLSAAWFVHPDAEGGLGSSHVSELHHRLFNKSYNRCPPTQPDRLADLRECRHD
jgi:hypothetical protein